MGIILASASPRRRELLTMLGFKDFKIIPARDEQRPEGLSAQETVKSIAAGKARQVYAQHGGSDVIIAADTLVFADGREMGKPESEDDARRMLKALSGRSHIVCTGVAVKCGGKEELCAETTLVRFRELSDMEIDGYIATGEPMDKAGAYGAQGKGAVFVKSVEGDFFNVMGLPLCRLCSMLKNFGIEVF